jgi:hypothetical protein
VHLWASNAGRILASELDLNWQLQRSQTPRNGGILLTMRSFRFGISQVYRSSEESRPPVDFKRHHYLNFHRLAMHFGVA